ncbi:MAG: protein kinase, partial [Deltaproteobacteria bacterium]|nr:protein kinase [Deltaproteobacteria bacterium]
TGGVGEVFSAEHQTSGAQAAVEVVNAQFKPEATTAYLDGVRKLQAVKHAGLVPILDVGVDAAGRSYVAMAPIEGEPLAKRITDLGRLSITQIGEIARQLANALAAIHDEGLVHGDLKPSCIFLLPQGALARGEPVKMIEVGAVFAKRASAIPVAPVYTAPEVWSANATDWRIDAYSLGCVIFEMATGKPPYLGKPEEIRAKHLSMRAPSARSMMPDVPPSLDVMLGRLMSKAPEDRYGSMREIARAFETIMGGATRAVATTDTSTPVFKGEIAGAPAKDPEAGVTSGELKARVTPAKEPPKQPEMASVVASGAVEILPEPAPMASPTASSPGPGNTTQIKKQGGSPLALVIILIVVVAGGGIAIAMMMS